MVTCGSNPLKLSRNYRLLFGGLQGSSLPVLTRQAKRVRQFHIRQFGMGKRQKKKNKKRKEVRDKCTPTKRQKLDGVSVMWDDFDGITSEDEESTQERCGTTPSSTTNTAVHVHTIELEEVHTDGHIEQTFQGDFAYPEGCRTFIDNFSQSNKEHHLKKVNKGERITAIHKEKKREIYTVEGEALQSIGHVDSELSDAKKLLEKLKECMATNLAEGSYRGISGHGYVMHVGRRYRYSEPQGSEHQKLDSWAITPDANPELYKTIVHQVQKLGNPSVRRVETWGRKFEKDMQEQRHLMDKVLSMDGTATFTFPCASIGINGGYACHRDKRDVAKTVWISLGTGALVFPQYEHIVHLHPGDIIVFNGHGEWHANMVLPSIRDVLGHWCKRSYSTGEDFNQMHQQLKESGVPGAGTMNQLIMCLYFQSQQRPYLVNRYNRDHPDSPLPETDNDVDGNTGSGNENLHDVSDYEITRQGRTEEHNVFLRRLGFDV